MLRSSRRIAALTLVLAGTGCSLAPAPGPVVANYDFGLPPEGRTTPVLRQPLLVHNVNAPGWLDSPLIYLPAHIPGRHPAPGLCGQPLGQLSSGAVYEPSARPAGRVRRRDHPAVRRRARQVRAARRSGGIHPGIRRPGKEQGGRALPGLGHGEPQPDRAARLQRGAPGKDPRRGRRRARSDRGKRRSRRSAHRLDGRLPQGLIWRNGAHGLEYATHRTGTAL